MKNTAHLEPTDRGLKTYLLIPIGFVVGCVIQVFKSKGENESRSE
jgi:hypothetical protein